MTPIDWVQIPEGTFTYGLTEAQKNMLHTKLWAEFGYHELSIAQQNLISGLIPKYRQRGRERGVYTLLSHITEEEKALIFHFTHHGKPLNEYLSIEDNLETIPIAQQIWLPSYQISKTPVTVAQATEYLRQHRSPFYLPDEQTFNQPQQLAFETCEEIASWLGARIPTPQEWEKAARGIDARLYPWGNEWDAESGNFQGITPAKDPNAYLSPRSNVERYPNGVSPYGVWDMCGNVSEWVFSESGGIQIRGRGFKEMPSPLWYWGMTTTWLPGGRGSGYGVGLRLVKS